MMTKVTGLFDTEKDANQAISALSKTDFGEVLSVVSQNQMIQEPKAADAVQFLKESSGEEDRGTLGKGTLPGFLPGLRSKTGRTIQEISEKDIRDTLTSKGVDSDEAIFYASAIKRGGTLVIVEVKEEQQDSVLEILSEFNAITPKS